MKLSYTILQFSEASGLGRSKIYQLIAEGRLKAVKCDGRTLITDEAGRALIDSLPPVEPEAA